MQITIKKYDSNNCNHVLEHIHNDKVALKNITSLNEKGYAILLTPFSKLIEEDIYMGMSLSYEKQLEYYSQEDHVRIYSQKNLISKIENAGFNLKLMKLDEFSSIKKMGLINEERIFLAQKL